MPTGIGITYLDGRRLARSLAAAADWVDALREELNRINVFPVPDGDTGTNFASTLRAVADAVSAPGHRPLQVISQTVAEAGILAARGNSGLLFSEFLSGFQDGLGGVQRATTDHVAAAMRVGADRLAAALDEPVEGTILTLARETAIAAERSARATKNFEVLLSEVVRHAKRSLEQTPELLPSLKEAGVVDAGAKAFVRTLEGILRLMKGQPVADTAQPAVGETHDAAAVARVSANRDYRFCTQVLVRGEGLPETAAVRAALRDLGGSVVALGGRELLKLHIHTDTPERVFELASTWGEVESRSAEDVREQHRMRHQALRTLTVVVDSSCDLPQSLVDRYGVLVVPLQIIAGNRTYQDGVDLKRGQVYELMRDAGTPVTTSQPPPGAFANAYREGLGTAQEVLCLTLASALSGTFSSAQAAARVHGGSGITVVDSRSGSLGLGLLALRAVELADRGLEPAAICADLERTRARSGGLFTVDTFENLLRSGRVSRSRAWLGSLLDLKPILEIDQRGRVVPLDRVRGQTALLPRVLDHLERRLTPGVRHLRFGVTHANAEKTAHEVAAALVARFSPAACVVAPVTATIGVHTGPGAWSIFYQEEDDSLEAAETPR